MKKQLAKGITMFMLVMSVALVTAVVSANGQTRKARATVPFDFVVGDKTLPAGDYNVDTVTQNGDALRVGNAASAEAAIRLTMTASGNSKETKLIFHRYGQHYFLAQVWSRGQGRDLAKSRQERAIEKEGARISELRHEAPQTFQIVEIASTLN